MISHQKQWKFLRGKFEAGQLSHAYLFSGPQEAGKEVFAKEFVKLINCLYRNSSDRQNYGVDGKPCGTCQNCKFIQSETFPDLLVVKSINSKSSIDNEKDMMEIDVAQVRDINTFLSYKAYYGNYKAIIIENAERLNSEAQNSFLKTLEEPKGKTLIILISSKPDILLPTIFSRCQTITFFPFGKYKESKQEEKILQELLGIIDEELAIKFQYTKKVNLEGNNINTILKVLQRYFRNMMLQKIGVVEKDTKSTNNYSIEKVKNIIRLIEKLQTQLTTSNASPKLALEILLLEL